MSNSTPSSPRNNIAVTEPSSPGTIEKGELNSRKSKKIVSPQRLPNNRTSIPNTHNNNAFIKYGSLLLLVGQMVGLVLLMRYTRTHTNGGDLYLASTAVFMMEVSIFLFFFTIYHCNSYNLMQHHTSETYQVMKFCICLGVVFYQTGNLTAELHKHLQLRTKYSIS